MTKSPESGRDAVKSHKNIRTNSLDWKPFFAEPLDDRNVVWAKKSQLNFAL